MITCTRSSTRRAGGFTLIEVIGALVIFSVGVLMVMQVSGALGAQMRYAAVRSEIVVLASQTVDSLEATPHDSLDAGSLRDTVTVQGLAYERSTTVFAVTPVLSRIDVVLSPVDSAGPSYGVTSYASAIW